MKERREGMEKIVTDIALIKQKASFIDQKIDAILKDMESYKSAITGTNYLKKEDLEHHAIQDRWMFGLVIVLLVCIFGKLIHG